MADKLRTLTIDDLPGFASIGEQWDDLCRGSACDNVFLTWDWVETWWEAFGATKQLALTAAYDGDELVGIAPLYRWRRDGQAHQRGLLLLGSGDSVSPDYLSFIMRRGHERAAAPALLGHALNRGPSPVLDLRDVPEDSPLVEWLMRDGGAGICCWTVGSWAECPYVLLPPRWQDYESSLSANMRYNLRRRTRRLLDQSGARLLRWHDTGDVPTGMEELARLHRARWSGRAEQYGFSDAGYVRFHGRVAERFAARGWLRLYGLEVDGRVIAAWYGYRYQGKLYYYQSGLDPEWERHSPGMVLKSLVIKDAIAEGVKELDLLKGAHSYKRAWADRSRRTLRVMIARPGARGRLLVAPVWWEQQKRRLTAMLPARSRAWLRKLRDRAQGGEDDVPLGHRAHNQL
jgi:CelD/BcsL family acetyltransferase involved in cellulose biosynthesis